MNETGRRIIYLSVMLHLVLMIFDVIHFVVGSWGIVMQVLYMTCLLEFKKMKTLIFIAAGGTFLKP